MNHHTQVVLKLSGDQEPMPGIFLGLSTSCGHEFKVIEQVLNIEGRPFRSINGLSRFPMNDLGRDPAGLPTDHRFALPHGSGDRKAATPRERITALRSLPPNDRR
jgi:hypothetical protein